MASNNVPRPHRERDVAAVRSAINALKHLSAGERGGRLNEGQRLEDCRIICRECTKPNLVRTFQASSQITDIPEETRRYVLVRFRDGDVKFVGDKSMAMEDLRNSLQLPKEPSLGGKAVIPGTFKGTQQMPLKNGSETRNKRPQEKKSTILGKLRRLFHPKRKAFVRTQFE